MIRITSGTVRTSLGLKTSKDKPFALPSAEEQRFIDRDVAARVYQEVPQEPVATPPDARVSEGVGVNLDEEKAGAEGDEGSDGDTAPVATIVDGHFVKDDLMKLTRDKLNKLAEDLGIEDPDKCANKGEVADLIAAIEVGDDEGDELPNLGAEEPVE